MHMKMHLFGSKLAFDITFWKQTSCLSILGNFEWFVEFLLLIFVIAGLQFPGMPIPVRSL